MNLKVLFIITGLCVLGCTRICAQGAGTTDSLSRHPLIHEIGVDFRPVYLIPTNEFFSGKNATWEPLRKSVSAHLKYSFRFHPESKTGKLYPYTYQGIGVSYHSFFDKAEIGTPVSVYAFQGSRIARLAPRLSLDYEWNFGASFGWEKYDPITNSYNYVVGSKINAYINLGLLLNWRLAAGWRLTAGVDLTHFSNGNTQYPNAGVNTVGGRIGLVHTFGENDGTAMPDRPAALRTTPHISYDIVLYGASKRKGVIKPDDSYLAPGSFGVFGFNFNPMYNFHKYFRAGASLDVQYDESANIKEYEAGYSGQSEHQFYRPPFKEQLAIGLSARGELVMPIFTINLGIGYNVYHKCSDTQGMYQIMALKTSITRDLFLHVGYQLSKFKDPNNLMLGIGYRFHNKR
ncbi:acyloxyacyl hydrolase [Parabacteroides acidifaciens]|uniref:Acyloxyacyl hydrolase n=1 Tax=Parabacteroides acidifaciens TaxID=2290935 RepID=A0A3D8HJP1_9BACT|nr:acyloxyacyl hydrolase [Parabacteroides acidifaciens]MBC8600342.1 acyloxyacyl hydrolase [Parabacteroides acidifaciens]RDU50972.1 acyloxyacyl hydrolase [Parabacteroides acidifaciens]